MNEHQFGNRIRRVLTDGARLDARIAERLRAARERALERRRVEPVEARERAHSVLGASSGTASSLLGSFGGFGGFSLRVVLPALVLAVGLFAIYDWQQDQRASDVEEIDAMLLTDDLPIDAYLDRGFEAWMRKMSTGARN